MENSCFVPLCGGPLDGIMQPLAMPPEEQRTAEQNRSWTVRKRRSTSQVSKLLADKKIDVKVTSEEFELVLVEQLEE